MVWSFQPKSEKLCMSLPFLKDTNPGESNLHILLKDTAASACLPQPKLCPAHSPPADHSMQPARKGPIILHDLLGLRLSEPAESCSSLELPHFCLFSSLFLCPRNRARPSRMKEVVERSELKMGRTGKWEWKKARSDRGPLNHFGRSHS